MKQLLKHLPFLFAAVTVAWLVLLSVHLYQTNSDLNQVNDTIKTKSTNELETIENSLLDLKERLQHLEAQPVYISQTQFTATQAQNQKNFERIQSRFEEVTLLLESLSQKSNDLNTFRQRLEQLETMKEARQKPSDDSIKSDRSSSVTASKPVLAPSSSPFKVIGMEMRGQEQLLAVRLNAPPHSIRLLRVGDALDKWTLTAIQSQKAQFRINNQVVHLTISK